MNVLIFISIYLVSAFLAYKHVQIAHSKDGRWSTLDTEVSDLVLVFLPCFNTAMALVGWLLNPPYRDNNLNSFFKIKK